MVWMEVRVLGLDVKTQISHVASKYDSSRVGENPTRNEEDSFEGISCVSGNTYKHYSFIQQPKHT